MRTCAGLKAKRVQCDEIWAFVGAKAKNATPEQKAQGWSDIWTWTALDGDSKLLVSFLGRLARSEQLLRIHAGRGIAAGV